MKMKKKFLFAIGCICAALGFIGVFLPIIPTTPFVLLALTCFMKSSEKMHRFVLENKYLAPYAKEYVSGNGIPIGAKKRAIGLIWLTIGFTTIVVIDRTVLRIMLLAIATIVSLYIWTRKTAVE
jgi:hypothetical protein